MDESATAAAAPVDGGSNDKLQDQHPRQDEPSMIILKGWTESMTEKLLRGPIDGADTVTFENDVVVLDHAMTDEDSSTVATENQGAAASNFCQSLLTELKDTKLLDKLQPAKTTGERQWDDALEELLADQGVGIPQELSLLHSSAAANNNVRGDKSIFVSRDYRQGQNRHDYQQRHPLLHLLVASISKTIEQQVELFSNRQRDSVAAQYSWDWSAASVQVASYPGDGSSGYPRHCDRGQDSCQDERSGVTRRNDRDGSKRLLTAIYYLVDDDWDETLDVGALRVFHRGQTSDVASDYTDIVPHQDRLVVFRSDRVEHQVLPSLRRSRTAITIWFYGSVTDPPPSLDLPSPLPMLSTEPNNKYLSIFVSIASYRDLETRPTLDAMFTTAKYPSRIYCGIVMQLEDGTKYDDTIWQDLQSFPKFEQLRYLRLHAKDAMGPCYARGLAQTLWRGEDYVLQIDSHMRFRPNWDVYLIQQCIDITKHAKNDKVMLTTYPLGYTLPNNVPKDETRGTYLVPWKFDDQGMLRQWAHKIVNRDESHSILPPKLFLYAGGFNFAPSQVIQNVPYDTMGLPHLFFGEELSMAVRLFTHGYDLYAPKETVCYHLWSRDHRPTAVARQNDSQHGRQKALSQKRVLEQLAGKSSLVGVPLGLGMERTAAEFSDRLKVDFSSMTLKKGHETGELTKGDFHVDERLHVDERQNDDLSPPSQDSLEAALAVIDPRAKELIASFLSGIS